MKNYLITSLFFFIMLPIIAQDQDYAEEELSINELISGTITGPSNFQAQDLVILIPGSGPTDRNGNQPMARNDGLKKIARELAGNGIASFRYDKRIFRMQQLQMKLEDLRFDDLVLDVKSIVSYFSEKKEYDHLILAGHSQGSLVGILASIENKDVKALISLAGPGQPIDAVIAEQFSKMSPELGENTRLKFQDLKENDRTENDNPMLASIFMPYVQTFLKSWIAFKPSEEIMKLKIQVLILNGTFDIQTEPKEAEMLHKSAENSRLVLLENMNHVFRKVESKDRLVNTKSYNEPNRPLHPELIPVMTDFIKELK